jgi:replicative DNA helicase
MAKKELVDGQFIDNYECICGKSSDAMSVYKKEKDGEIVVDAYCRSGFCERDSGYISPKELEEEGFDVNNVREKEPRPFDPEEFKGPEFEFRGFKQKRITKTVSEKYGVFSRVDENHEPLSRFYPETREGELVGYHERILPKDFIKHGNGKSTNELFGQNVFESGQKFLVITTGQEDAMAVAQVLRYEKDDGTEFWTPCVSVSCGDESVIKQLKANFQYINSFEKVIFMFDQDEAGQKHVDAACRLVSPGKAYVAKLSHNAKDPAELLEKKKASAIKQAFWKAEPFNRTDVLHLNQMWDDFESEDSNVKIPFPQSWNVLNEMMNGGGERGEITLFGALTSIGKSTLVNNFVYNLIENTSFKVGTMYLEGTRREVVRDLLSLDMGENLRKIDRKTFDMEGAKKRFFKNLAEKDQFVFVDHQGSISTEGIFDKLNYLAKAEGCDVIVIDPVQTAVNSSDNSAIIEFMDTLLKFAKETDTYIVVVSHMRKPDSDDPHNVSEYDLLGSSALNQISYNTILASRDKMAKNPRIRNATKLQMVKCRRTGETGEAGWLRFDDKTTHMYATSDPYEDVDREMSDEEALNSFGNDENDDFEDELEQEGETY